MAPKASGMTTSSSTKYLQASGLEIEEIFKDQKSLFDLKRTVNRVDKMSDA